MRGACVHWAHPHAASFLISRACAAAYRDFGWTVFFAYSDRMAGEIGTVYQACNWRYVGVGAGRGNGTTARWRFFNKAEERWYSARMLGAHGLSAAQVRASPTWFAEKQPDKCRYVHFEGSRRDRKQARSALKYLVLPYSRRETPPPSSSGRVKHRIAPPSLPSRSIGWLRRQRMRTRWQQVLAPRRPHRMPADNRADPRAGVSAALPCRPNRPKGGQATRRDRKEFVVYRPRREQQRCDPAAGGGHESLNGS
jgi:hypothetical protein